MEEVQKEYLGETLEDICTKMYHKVRKDNPVIGWVNGVRIIMFSEEEDVNYHYDDPR